MNDAAGSKVFSLQKHSAVTVWWEKKNHLKNCALCGTFCTVQRNLILQGSTKFVICQTRSAQTAVHSQKYYANYSPPCRKQSSHKQPSVEVDYSTPPLAKYC